MKIILNTNFLIDCIRFKIDLKAETMGNELFVLKPTLYEIERIIERGTNESTLAKIALELIKKSKIKIIESEKEVDESLLSFSKKGYAIATHDRALKSKLKEIGAKLIYVRQKKYLMID